ncbi:MAG: hypothetical protein JXX28_19425 [Deltaproteobacteria bacterium]|nr:hypothetical protein [Deltaproteobacteria bacterium]
MKSLVPPHLTGRLEMKLAQILCMAALGLSGCDDKGPRMLDFGTLYDWELECWDTENIPPVPYCDMCLSNFVDGLGQCWKIQSTSRPVGEDWGTAPISLAEACPEHGLDGWPECYYVLGYDPE